MERIIQMIRAFLFYSLLFCLFLLQTGCQVSTIAEVAPTQTVTAEPTLVPVASDTPILASTSTSSPTTTAEPSFAPPVEVVEPTVTVTTVPTPSPWQIDVSSNFLLYERGESIYLYRPGEASSFVTDGYLLGGQPWSPDGTRIVFNNNLDYQRNPLNQAAVANLITGQISIINLLAPPGMVFWAPSGEFLLYRVPVKELVEGASYVDTNLQAQIAVYDFESGENKLLTDTSNILRLVGWSPDSRKIAFISSINDHNAQIENGLYTYGQFDLYVLDVETLVLQQLTDTSDIELLAAWSPTEELIVFGATAIDERWPSREYILEFWPWVAENLYLMDMSSNILTTLSGSTSVTWSPDGTKVLYAGDPFCMLEVETFLTNCLPAEGLSFDDIGVFPSWSADGKMLAFHIQDPEMSTQCFTIYVLDIAKNQEEKIDPGQCFHGPHYWSRIAP
jgi:Tol biopolymer transport system component